MKRRKVLSYKDDPKADLTNSEVLFKDYPVIASAAFKKLFGDFEKFESYYLPLIRTANRKLPLFALKWLCKIKYGDIFSP